MIANTRAVRCSKLSRNSINKPTRRKLSRMNRTYPGVTLSTTIARATRIEISRITVGRIYPTSMKALKAMRPGASTVVLSSL